jgi:hypothetical protein
MIFFYLAAVVAIATAVLYAFISISYQQAVWSAAYKRVKEYESHAKVLSEEFNEPITIRTSRYI